ncbi:hypothetical protein [Coralloluteibacterium thermophilus]|uniref:Uncharacterized protein n=1 Tax=Coralloluteibacterium thermophilum TaxID=2707049 RepID=A0ABV9NJP4_9GAMM
MQSKTGITLIALAAALALFLAGLLIAEPTAASEPSTEAVENERTALPAAAIRARVQVGMPFFSFAKMLPVSES